MSEALAGIPLSVAAPRHYLEVLWLAIHQFFPDHADLAEVAREIEARLGGRPRITADHTRQDHMWRIGEIIGWSGSRMLGQLIDREWLPGDQNEFEPLASELSTCEALREASSVLICGAGVCRLGSHLAERGTVESVRCTDLSFLSLYFGRMLIEGRHDLLPETFRRPRTILSVDAQRKSLQAHQEDRTFHRAGKGKDKLTYEVADIFQLSRGTTESLICLPYLLDVFREAQMTTALIRICARLPPGQRFLLVVAATPRRDPRQVIRTLEDCGLSVDRLRLSKLPYSSSTAGYGFVATTYDTLIAEATKRSETDPGRLTLVPARVEPGSPDPVSLQAFGELPGQREQALPLTPEQWEAVRSSLGLGCLSDVERFLEGVLGESLADAVLARLLGSGCCNLVCGS